MRIWPGFSAAMMGLLVWTAGAADVTVVRPGEVKTGIDLSGLRVDGGASSMLFQKTLENDLKLSGWFTLMPRGGAVAVQGACSETSSGLTVDCDVVNRSAGQRYFNKRFDEDRAAARKLAHRVADEIVRAVKNVPGIAATRIAMVGMRQGRKNLYLGDADGGDLVQLTKDNVVCMSPRWAPDARSLVYTAFLNGFPDVFRIDLDTNQRKVLSNFSGLNACGDISPDGRELVLTLSKDGNPDVYIMDLGTRMLTRITRTPQAAEASPSWSPDGRRIVYVSDKSGSPQLYVTDRAGGAEKRITFRGLENVAPDWGPNNWIAYVSRRAGRYVIFVLDPATQIEQPISGDDGDYENPSWAPDGRHLVCSKKVNYHSDIYVLDTKGDNPLRLTRVEGDWSSPAWSPK